MTPWYHLISRAGARALIAPLTEGTRPRLAAARFSGAAPGRASRAASRELSTSRSLSGLRAARLIPVIAFCPPPSPAECNCLSSYRAGGLLSMRRAGAFLNFSVFHKSARPPPGENRPIRQKGRRRGPFPGDGRAFFRKPGRRKNQTVEFNEKRRKNVRFGWTFLVE